MHKHVFLAVTCLVYIMLLLCTFLGIGVETMGPAGSCVYQYDTS